MEGAFRKRSAIISDVLSQCSLSLLVITLHRPNIVYESAKSCVVEIKVQLYSYRDNGIYTMSIFHCSLEGDMYCIVAGLQFFRSEKIVACLLYKYSLDID